tara:strand:+ start:176 stop:661 length:486 start_codon:yes stop_codon:yes gene_type:complete
MFSDPQFWVAIAFIAFVVAVFSPVRKILNNNLDQKIKYIKDSIDEAENLKNEAKVTLIEIKKRQNEVQKKIELIKKDSENKVKNIQENAEQKLKNQIQKREILTAAKIDQLTREANLDIQKHISSSSILATIKLLEKKLNKEEKQNLINSSINELNSVLKN